ncbi:MAG: BNR repeat-containing protein [Chitinophagaceae bacterium]
MNRLSFLLPFSFFLSVYASAQKNTEKIRIVNVDSAWANNSVNTVVFRKNSLVSFKDTQFIAYYNSERFVVLGKRKIGATNWILKQTVYKGNTNDAHNTISIMVDGDGYLHLAWDHHNNPLRYCKSIVPRSLDMTDKMPMIGNTEQRVSYPEFFKQPDGGLLFLYRDGGSGQGNLVINKYDIHTKQWTRLHSNLIDGQGQRSAYWQTFVDQRGTIHISWVWRESPDVASNHDMCYARSEDGGISWSTSTGKKYTLPINAGTAEIACKIPQNSELINQTSMFADASGMYIATYWREAGDSVPQYHIIYKTGKEWKMQSLGFRKTPFSLSGAGTKRIPISRPQIIAWKKGKKLCAGIVFRDAERGDKVSIAVSKNITKPKWEIHDLTQNAVGSWEPSYDTELWKAKGILHLFVQRTEQVDGEGRANIPPQMVQVVEWDKK